MRLDRTKIADTIQHMKKKYTYVIQTLNTATMAKTHKSAMRVVDELLAKGERVGVWRRERNRFDF